VAFEVEDGISDELTGAVPGCLSATIDLENRMRQRLGAAKAGSIARPPNRIDRLVFQQQELLAFGSGEILLDQPVLQIQSRSIFQAAKPLDIDGFHFENAG
jgi:hypothetical protein